MDRDYSPKEVLAIVRRRRWAVLTAVFLGLGLASAAAIAMPKSYKARTRIEVTANKNIPGSDTASKVDAVREQMLSLNTMMRVVEELKLDEAPGAPAGSVADRRAAIAKNLVNSVHVEKEEPVEGTYYILAECSSRDPDTCHLVLDSLVSRYKAELYERPRLQQIDVVASCRTNAELAKSRVDEAQEACTAYEKSNGEFLGPIEDQRREMLREIQKIEDTDVVRAKQQIQNAEEYLKSEVPYTKQENKKIDSVRMANLETELNAATRILNELTVTKKYTDEHPAVKSARMNVEGLEKQKAELERNAGIEVVLIPNPLYLEYSKQQSEAKSSLLVANQQIASLNKNLLDLQRRGEKAPEIRNQRDRLLADLKTAQQVYDDRTKEFQKAEDKLRDVESERQLNFSIVEPPLPPKGPAGPAPAIFALGGLLVGAAGGLGLAWLIDVNDTSFREVDAVSEFIGVPALGAIHSIQTPSEAAESKSKTMRMAIAVAALGFVASGLAGWSILASRPAADAAAVDGSR